MVKDRFYSDFSRYYLDFGYHSMLIELAESNAPDWLCTLFIRAWEDFEKEKFSYDGATFVPERYKKTIFEVASFIHDWLNSIGFVGRKVDDLFVLIMLMLDYDKKHIWLRKFLMFFTPLNVIRHIIKDTYKGDLPVNFIKK